MKNLILDFANLAAILRFGALSKDSSTLIMSDDDWVNYFLDMMLVNISNYVNVLKSDRVIITLESRSWRKTYYPLYKANRDAGKEEDDKLELFYRAVNLSADFFKDFTNAKIIQVEEAEGDDIVAVLTQMFATNGDKTTIVSTDGDFKQLLRYKGVRIFNPVKKNYVIGGYSHLDYITKLVKGDAGDNVPSSYPRIKLDILESLANDESKFEQEFEKVDKTIERQKYYISKFLKVDDLPDDLSTEEWSEVLLIAKEKKDKLKAEIKKAKEFNEYKTDNELVEKDKYMKEILKLAKKEDITEARLFNVINSFRDGYERNKKLICLKIDNLPEHVVENIISDYNQKHTQTKQSTFLKYVRQHKLREFAFGQEWNVLKSIKDLD